MQKPKIKVPISTKVVVVNQKQIESDLLREELLQLKDGEVQVSEKGRRFVADFEKLLQKSG